MADRIVAVQMKSFEVRTDIGVGMSLRIGLSDLEDFVEVVIRHGMLEVPSIVSSSGMDTSHRHHKTLETCPDTQNDSDCLF